MLIIKTWLSDLLVDSVSIDPITPQKSQIHSLSRSDAFTQPGHCPQAKLLAQTDCSIGCTKDTECTGSQKCCPALCGNICSLPERTNGSFYNNYFMLKVHDFEFKACIHLLSAIERLPDRQLLNGYVPACDAYANFNIVQCDNVNKYSLFILF